jgi:hypothetical protein
MSCPMGFALCAILQLFRKYIYKMGNGLDDCRGLVGGEPCRDVLEYDEGHLSVLC